LHSCHTVGKPLVRSGAQALFCGVGTYNAITYKSYGISKKL